MSPSKPQEPQRIAKLLARAGIASRREIERMIAEGRVSLNGTVLDTPATLLTSLAGVSVDGKPVKAAAPARLFRFHKPAGLITAERDPAGRKTIYSALPPELPRVMPVGRLDLNTEGLLLLTTDGELKRQLELPSSGVERSYRARAFGNISQAQLEDLIEGVEIDGVRYGSIDANLERRTGANVWIELTLTEGKNREVRRVLEHLGLQVSRLIRTRYGPFGLDDMPSGAIDEVRSYDLLRFRKALEGSGGGAAASRISIGSRGYASAIPAPHEEPEPETPPHANRATRRAADGRSKAAPGGKPRAQASTRTQPRERIDRPDRMARTDRTARDERPGRSDRTDRFARTDGASTGRRARGEDRANIAERPERPARSGKPLARTPRGKNASSRPDDNRASARRGNGAPGERPRRTDRTENKGKLSLSPRTGTARTGRSEDTRAERNRTDRERTGRDRTGRDRTDRDRPRGPGGGDTPGGRRGPSRPPRRPGGKPGFPRGRNGS